MKKSKRMKSIKMKSARIENSLESKSSLQISF